MAGMDVNGVGGIAGVSEDCAGDAASKAGAGVLLPLWLLAAAFLLPAVETAVAVYFEIAPALTYPLLKGAMILLPILVWRRRRWSSRVVGEVVGLKRPTMWGVGMGVLMAGVILAGYYFVLDGFLAGGLIVAKVTSLGLDGWRYVVMALFISLGNSLFEEYYWRGFLLSELRMRVARPAAACLIAGAVFGLHHVFALAPLFSPGFAAAFAVGTMLAGGVWAWMRVRGMSILDCFVSHIFADFAIMWVGWDLIAKAGG